MTQWLREFSSQQLQPGSLQPPDDLMPLASVGTCTHVQISTSPQPPRTCNFKKLNK